MGPAIHDVATNAPAGAPVRRDVAPPRSVIAGARREGLDGRSWAAITSVAAAVRAAVAFGLLGAMPLVSDAHDYFALATRLAQGQAVGAFYWPPGESLALVPAFAVAGPSLVAARLITIAFGVATVVLVALLGRELDGPRTARAAGWIAALYPPSVLLSGQTYAQHLAALCLAAVAYFGLRALRERRLGFGVLAGLALGLGCLTRPSMISVAPVLAGAWVLALRPGRAPMGRAILVGGAAAVVALACVVPVQAHDARSGAGWTISTNNERNLFLGNNPYTPDYKTSHLGQRSLSELDPDARAYLESFYERPDARDAMRREALAYMTGHPVRTAWRTLNRATSFWGFDYLASREIQRWRGWSTATTAPLLLVEGAGFIGVAALALLGLFALPGAGDRGWRWWLVALALAYEAPYVIAFSGGTYHFPVVPLLVPLAGLAVTRPKQTWNGLRARRRAQAALCVLALVQLQYAYYAVTMTG